MYIPGRERQIIDILLKKETPITIKELAEKLEVSVRTIHRDLQNVEATLKKSRMNLIKKAGVGLLAEGTDKDRLELLHTLSMVASYDYTPEERQAIILASLFATREPVKLFALASDLHVTIATISNDLNELESQLTEYKLTLVRKRGFGVLINGEEKNKRQAISGLITKYIDPFKLVTMYKEKMQKGLNQHHDIADRLLGFIQAERLEIIEKAVESIKEELPYELADDAYIGLIVHLALAVERLKSGDTIDFDQAYLQQIASKDEYKIAAMLIHQLEDMLEIKIPEDEIGYITMHLLGAKLRLNHHYIIEDSAMDIAYKAKELIQYVSTVLHVQLQHSTTLLNDLVAHLKPAIYRMKKEMKITNPIIDEIERDYKELYQLLKDAVKSVFPNLDFPRDEIGFLVLHFGSVLFYNQSVKHVKVLVVCASGIGTAKILATQLQQQFPEMTYVDHVSMFELVHTDPQAYDLVLSTVTLMEHTFPYILVSPILTEKERQKIKHKLRKMLVTYKSPAPDILDQSKDYLDQIGGLRRYTTIMHDLIQTIYVTDWQQAASFEAMLFAVCQDLKDKQYLHNEEAVYRKLRQREKQGGLGIPDSTLALYHTRTNEITKPSLTIYRVNQSFPLLGMGQETQRMNSLLMMLAPEDTEPEVLEVLSFISSLLIQHPGAIHVLVTGKETEIKQFLSRELYSFLKDKNLI